MGVAKAVAMELFKDRQPVQPYRQLVSRTHLQICIYLVMDSFILSEAETIAEKVKRMENMYGNG